MRVAYLGPAGTFSEDALEVSRFAPEGFEVQFKHLRVKVDE